METKHFELIVEKHSAEPKNKLRNTYMLREAAQQVLIAAIDSSPTPPDEVDAKYLADEINTQLSNTLFWVVRCALDNGTTIDELMRNEFSTLAVRSSIRKSNYTQ